MLPPLRAILKNLWIGAAIVLLFVPLWAPVQAQDATPMATPRGAEPTLETLLDTIQPYPTFSEAVFEAARLLQDELTGFA